MSFLSKFSIKNIFTGDPAKKTLKKYASFIKEVNDLESSVSKLSNEDIKAKTADLRKIVQEKIKNHDDRKFVDSVLNDIRGEAFALVREVSRRTLNQRHFDVQIIGGAVLHEGNIAEMRTGEGKTLVATLPAYLNALTGRGVHVITVNDYLSRRDAVWMGQIYNALGLSVAVINHDASYIYDPSHTKEVQDKERDSIGSFHVVYDFLRPITRKEAYEADITYGTNSEFGFDYLRDNLEYDKNKIRQKDFNYAIVDEIDSILIDEARTPLIISAPTTNSEELYVTMSKIVRDFEKDADYIIDEKRRQISLTDGGISKAEKALGVENIYTDKGIKYVHHLETAIKAKALYQKDKQYVVRDGEIMIVDEFTGRMQPGRRWSEGLHQAVEAKEGVPIQKESRTFASVTYQNYFRMYKKLSGMTGTAATSDEEFFKVYGLSVIIIPTNKEVMRKDHNDLIFQTEKGKMIAIARTVKEKHEKGQPVLVGTVSIEKNEVLSSYLRSEGIPHEILNAKNHEREGEIIAQAGKKGAVTIATNMAGRGVDIKLGGNPATKEKYEEIKTLGGLFVLGTERHEARRIDNQLRGRSGRQGDPGETQFFVSLEDELMRVFANDTLKSLMGRLGVKEDEPVQHGLVTRSLENAQKRIEGFHFDSRKHVLEYDDVLNQQRKTVYGERRSILLGDVTFVENKIQELIGDDSTLVSIIDNKIKEISNDRVCAISRQLMLQTIDMFWVEHLEIMDYMRSSVNLRAYGQRDPLVEYKKEGLRLFKEMQYSVKSEIKRLLPNVMGGIMTNEEIKLVEIKEDAKKAQESVGGEKDIQNTGNRHARRALKKQK